MKALLVFTAFSAVLIHVISMCLAETDVGKCCGRKVAVRLSKSEENRLVNYSLDAFHKKEKSPYLYKVIRVNGVTAQPVAGIIYRLKLELGETKCLKGSGVSDCELKDPSGSNTMKCEFSVYERSWDNFRNTMVTSCNN